MTVDPAKTQFRLEHDGRTFVFCCAGCRAKFAAEPARYLDTAGAVDSPSKDGRPSGRPMDPAGRAHRARLQQQEPVPPGTIFTCPMHPEVRQIGPGACPICGMALEPLSPSVETGPNAELIDMKRRLWFALTLAFPVVVLDMGGHLSGANWLAPQVSNWLQLVLATPVALGAGWPFFVRAAASIRTGNLNMFTLIATGVGVAWLASVVATVAPGVFPHAFHTHGGAPPVYFEAAAVITVLVLVGQVLELTARERTGDAIRALLDLQPKRALRIAPDGSEQDVDLDRIAVGDVLRVRPGEKVPADGVVVEGASAVDEALMTGESMPVPKAAGAKLIAGAVNGSGGLVMRAERVGRDTALARMIDLVGEGPAQPRAGAAPGRPCRRLVRAARRSCRGARLSRMGAVRPRAQRWPSGSSRRCRC